MYVQALLHECGKGEIDDWAHSLGELNDGDLRTSIADLLRHLLHKVKEGDQWTNLPADAVGGCVREMREEVPKVVSMALMRILNDAWRQTTSCNAGRLVPVGYFQTFSFFKDVDRLLKQKGAERSVATGTEAKQRREHELFDHEQLLLFESILSCSVAEHQRERKESTRHPTDNLNLGMIVALQFALGKRCMNVSSLSSVLPHVCLAYLAHACCVSQLDDLKLGYLEMTRFSSFQVWDNVLAPYLALWSSSKGEEVGGRKHLAGIMHHRDPMRCALCMIGLYFAYQFFELQLELPSLDKWLETMHQRPLICLQCGRKVHTTEYNALLRQDLELIGAKYSDFTLHGIRNQRIGEAHEDPNMRGDAIMNGVGHSTGSHFDNYKGCLETSYMLNSVGYRGTDPQMLASHVETLLEYMYERHDEAKELVDILYRTHRPELLDLEHAAAIDTTEAGKRMREFLHYLRHCLLAWIVSTTARPRTRKCVPSSAPLPLHTQSLAISTALQDSVSSIRSDRRNDFLWQRCT
jgi:hypothetical protein